MRLLILFIISILVFSFSGAAQAQDAGKGQDIFKRKCKGCHRLSDGVKVGPGLLGVTTRRTEEWLHRWLQNPKGMIKSGDPIAVKLKKKYKKTMRTLKAMQVEKNRKDIIAFLKKNDSKLVKTHN